MKKSTLYAVTTLSVVGSMDIFKNAFFCPVCGTRGNLSDSVSGLVKAGAPIKRKCSGCETEFNIRADYTFKTEVIKSG